MTDLLKPIVSSLHVDVATELDDALLENVRRFREFAPNVNVGLAASAELMDTLRAGGARTMVANVVRLRQAMLQTRDESELYLDCAVTPENSTHIGSLARLALSLGFDGFNVVEAANGMLGTLTDDEARRFADSMIDAVIALNGTATKLILQSSLRNRLEPLVSAMNDGRHVTGASFRRGAEVSQAGPRLRPWETVLLLNSDKVKLCAGPTEPIGTLSDDELFKTVNGSAARELRATMLRGGPGLPCKACSFATADEPAAFVREVTEAHARYDATVPPWRVFLPAGLRFDSEFGVTTQARLFLKDLEPEVTGSAVELATHYLPSPVADLDRMLDVVPLAPERSTFIDVGSGMGRVVFYAAQRPYREVIGVELSPALAKVADANLAAYRGPRFCGNIRLVCSDVLDFKLPDGDLIIYLFNPFKAPVMERFADRLAAHDGHVAIVYLAPAEAETLDAHPAFVPFAEVELEDRRNAARLWVSRNMQK